MKILAPLAVLLLGVLVAAFAVLRGPEAETVTPERPAPLVRVVRAQPRTVQHVVRTHGTVEPRTESVLVPEVSGRVEWVSPDFDSGGFFDEGDALVRLDRRDYEVALERARAGLERAESQWQRDRKDLERRQKLAEREFASPAQLDVAVTQERVSRAALREARAILAQAERDLARTEMRAPFTGRVREASVDVGQFVARGSPIATLYATDYAEIRLPVPDDELAFLDLPLWHRNGEPTEGPAVELFADFAGAEHRWRGRVVRTEGEIDPRTRMVHVVARVDDPYAVRDDRPPLAVGLFVEAEIRGREARDVLVVPRIALREGGAVYVVDEAERLRVTPVDVVRTTREEAVLGGGIDGSARIVVSPLPAAVDGMEVRAVAADEEPAGAGPAPGARAEGRP